MNNEGGHPVGGRAFLGTLMLAALLLLVLADLFTAEPIDPYLAPYPVALGSGQAPSGAHCTVVVAPQGN